MINYVIVIPKMIHQEMIEETNIKLCCYTKNPYLKQGFFNLIYLGSEKWTRTIDPLGMNQLLQPTELSRLIKNKMQLIL